MFSKDNNKIFIEVCKKAGLEVESKPSKQIKNGIIISDAIGHQYTVDSNGQLQRCVPTINVHPQKAVSIVPSSMKVVKISGKGRAGHIIASRQIRPIKRRLKTQED